MRKVMTITAVLVAGLTFLPTAQAALQPQPVKLLPPLVDEPQWTPEELSKGYVAYSDSYLNAFFNCQVPRREWIKETVSCQLARDEYEPLQIGVYAMQGKEPLEKVKIEVDIDLPVTVRVIEYTKYWHEVEGRPDLMVPEYLPLGSEIESVEPGTTRAFWLTFHAPADAAAGEHRGTIRVTAQGREPTELQLAVAVLPFELPRADIAFGMYYYRVIPLLRNDDYQRMVYRDMRAHGMTSVSVYVFHSEWVEESATGEGKVKFDPAADEELRLMKEEGLYRRGIPVHIEEYNVGCHQSTTFVTGLDEADQAEAARQYWQRVRRHNYPELLLYLKDEPSVDQPPAYFRWAIGWKKSSLRTITAMSVRAASQLGYLHDIWEVYAGGISPEMLKEAKRSGCEVWTYDHTFGHSNALANRYYTGLYTWGLGLKGNFEWIYFHAGDNYVRPVDEEPKPKVSWEGRREGIDDYCYLQLLEKAVAAADKHDRVAHQARAWLDKLRQEVDWQFFHGRAGGGRDYFLYPAPEMSMSDYDALRARAADYITKLGVPRRRPLRRWPAASKIPKFEASPFLNKTVDECLAGLSDPDMHTRRSAAAALALRGPEAAPAVPALVRALRDPDVRLVALRALGAIGPEAASAVPAVAAQARLSDAFMRLGATYALGGIGPAAIEPLRRALQDDSPAVVLAAGQGLGKMGAAAEPAVPDLAPLLEAEQYARAAITALTGIGPGAVAAVPALIKYYLQQEGKAPYTAAALAAIGPHAEAAIEALEKYAEGTDWYNAYTWYALFCIRGEQSDLEALTNLLWDGDEKYGQPYAAKLLDKLGRRAKPVEARVRKWLQDGEHQAMRAHLESLLKKLAP